MSQEQQSTITGNVYEVYTPTHQDYLEGRMPRIGQRCIFEDGRKFIFCSTKVSLTVGQVLSAPVEIASAVAAAWPKGVRTINLTEAGIVANAWAGGYLTLDKVTYKIKGNTATGGPAVGLVAVTLYDTLQNATTDTKV
jgi:hypothetical protein